MKEKILVTGASGFVGQRFLEYNSEKYEIKTVSLKTTRPEDIDFNGISSIVHLAGMAHQMQKIDPQIYFDVNFELTKKLAIAAERAKVSQFVFISTIKVFGEYQKAVLNLESPCIPENDPYGESKLKAEEFLNTINSKTFKVAILRPPLIYGPRVKGNLIRFLKLGNKSFPLPFKAIPNKRTMVFLDNFIEMINQTIHIKAEGTFLAGDDRPISTSELIKEIRRGLGNKTRLFKMPSLLKELLYKLKPQLYIRLFESLEMETRTSNEKLNFKPPYSIEHGIKSMVDWYKTTL